MPATSDCCGGVRILRTAQEAYAQNVGHYGTERDLVNAGFLGAELELYDTRPAAPPTPFDIVVADEMCGTVGSVVAP